MDDGTRAEADGPAGRGRLRGALNTAFVLVAVAGIGLSVWALVSEVLDLRDRAESRERIAEGCGGLVDPDLVLGLKGGVSRVKLSDRHHISTARSDSGCVVYRVGDPGTTYGHVSLDLTLYPANPNADEHQVDPEHEPFDYFTARNRDDVTAAAQYALPHPLGDGGLGEYDSRHGDGQGPLRGRGRDLLRQGRGHGPVRRPRHVRGPPRPHRPGAPCGAAGRGGEGMPHRTPRRTHGVPRAEDRSRPRCRSGRYLRLVRTAQRRPRAGRAARPGARRTGREGECP